MNEVLAENFVNITESSTFVMNMQHYDGAFPYLFATWGILLLLQVTMQHDLAVWTWRQSLPYATLSGSEINQITQYFDDEVSTCGVSPTVGGCGATYYEQSSQDRWEERGVTRFKVSIQLLNK